MNKVSELQPLRIPAGWNVLYNGFLEIEPTSLAEDSDLWLSFTQDILQLGYKFRKMELFVDLGWYPETEIGGTFRLVVIKHSEWENPLEVFESRSKKEIVERMESILEDVSYWRKYENVFE